MRKINLALTVALTMAVLAALSWREVSAGSGRPIKSLDAGGAVVGTDLVEVSRSELGGDRWSPFSIEMSAVTTYVESTIDTLTNLAVLVLGQDGTAGRLDLFAPTTDKGRLRITPQDNTGDTVLTVSNRAQSGVATAYVPDLGGVSSDFAINGPNEGHAKTCAGQFAEAGDTSYDFTCELPAGAWILDVCWTNVALWDDGTSATLLVGDDDDPNGWFDAVNLKATDALVGEMLCAGDDGTWGGVNGVYLTAAGRRGRVTAGVDSGWFVGAATEVIFNVTTGAQNGTAGRSRATVHYSVPSYTAATATP